MIVDEDYKVPYLQEHIQMSSWCEHKIAHKLVKEVKPSG